MKRSTKNRKSGENWRLVSNGRVNGNGPVLITKLMLTIEIMTNFLAETDSVFLK